jgi:hypothetical protein
MKKRILRNLQHYRKDLNLALGKPLILTGEYNLFVRDRKDETYGTVYGTLQEFSPQSITLGNFIDYHFPVNVSEEQQEKTIRLLESLHMLRTTKTMRVELTDRLQAYVVDLS